MRADIEARKREQTGYRKIPNQEVIMTHSVSQGICLEEQVLLHELDHRIVNEFASVISAVSLAARGTSSDEAKGALSAVAKLLHHYADVHRALQMPTQGTLVDAAAYLRELCLSISRSKLESGEIRLVLAAQPLQLESDRCWRLGMIVHELISNASRHAFACGKGSIRIELARAGAFVECRVLDDGSAAANVQQGRGLKIVNELTKGLGGRFEHSFGSRGSMFVIAFPYSRAWITHHEISPKRSGGSRRAGLERGRRDEALRRGI